jgi:hypothetical protein
MRAFRIYKWKRRVYFVKEQIKAGCGKKKLPHEFYNLLLLKQESTLNRTWEGKLKKRILE